MCHIEEAIFNNCPSACRPVYYKRYVDDTFLLFQSKIAAELFLEHANNAHPQIKFTIEHEEDNCISFLDVLITRNERNFSTTVFHNTLILSKIDYGCQVHASASNRVLNKLNVIHNDGFN